MIPIDTQNPESIKQWNEKMIDKYHLGNYFDHPNPIIRLIETMRIRKILSQLVVDENADTLEVGCGDGYILLHVPKGRLHGFDLSERLVELTAKKITSQFPSRLGTLVAGNAEVWPEQITTRRYTNIYSSEVIEHIPHPEKLLEELYRAVTDETKAVVVTTPNEPLINRIKKLMIGLRIFTRLLPGISADMTEEWHLTSFDLPLMKKLCEGKFLIKKIQGVPFRWLPLRYVYTLKKIP